MATPNYGYEKRQRELAKKQKKLDKERSKAGRKVEYPDTSGQGSPGGGAGSGTAPGQDSSGR